METNVKGFLQGNMSIVVLNADGTVKADLGMVNYTHRNPIIRFFKSRWVTFFANRRIKAFNQTQGEINGN